MNTSLVKAVPVGAFADVSVLRNGWQDNLALLVSQKKRIRYDMYPLSGMPPELTNHLERQGYSDLVLENDRWQHFLVPQPNEPVLSESKRH